ncbi:MAG: DUF6456 domain-containing protein, partial [Pseudomonadota bacterium]
SWVPVAAFRYIAHTERGASIRGLARDAGCHASTILRQVRAYEARRDDPLVDDALHRLGARFDPGTSPQPKRHDCDRPMSQEDAMTALKIHDFDNASSALTDDRLKREARRVLRRLCETGAVLAVAAEMDKAVVVRETDAGSIRTAVVDRDVAEAMALKNWISAQSSGRIARYAITGAGRVALEQVLSEPAELDAGLTETEAAFLGDEESEPPASGHRRKRYGVAESPLVLLARRRDKDGARFLSDVLVRAGERLREDFEMAELEFAPGASWADVMTAFDECTRADLTKAMQSARTRVKRALEELGPGLGDVSMKCCCFLEGLEVAEKRLGWSARSGKIVLRIALQRLKRHYDQLGDSASMMG